MTTVNNNSFWQKVPKRDKANTSQPHVQNTAKARARCAATVFVVPAITFDFVNDTEVVPMTLQLPIGNQFSQLHYSAPRIYTAMQYSCYKIMMQCYKFWMVGWSAVHCCGWAWLQIHASPICNCMHCNVVTPTVQSSNGMQVQATRSNGNAYQLNKCKQL